MAVMHNLIARSRNLIKAPIAEFTVIMGEQPRLLKIFKQYLLPYFIAFAITSYLGNIIFGPLTFHDGTLAVIKLILITALTIIIGLYTIVFVLYRFQQKIGFKTGKKTIFIWFIYSLTPLYISLVVSGLIPRLSNLINLFGLFSFYLLWVSAGLFYQLSNEKQQIVVPVCSAIALAVFLFYRIALGFLLSPKPF